MPVLESPRPAATPTRSDNDLLIDLDGTSIAPTPAKRPLFHRPAIIVGAAAVLVLAILYTATIFFHALTHESTDDAFIDAHIVSIAPKIAGRISAVRVGDTNSCARTTCSWRSIRATSPRWSRNAPPRSMWRRRTSKMHG